MRAVRIAVVTVGLMAAGAVFGGLAGVIVALALTVSEAGIRPLLVDASFLLIGGVFGGALGAVLGPLAAWLLMRHVPLGLAVGGATLGTVAGAVLSLLVGAGDFMFEAGVAGFVLSALWLRFRVPRQVRPLRPGVAADRLHAGGG